VTAPERNVLALEEVELHLHPPAGADRRARIL
jgi:hypothetical protein